MKTGGNSKQTIALFIFTIFISTVHAQNDYARGVAGLNLETPVLKDGYKASNWRGLNARSKLFEFGFSTGNVTQGENQLKGNIWYVGANYAFQNFKFGNRQYGIKGFLVIPFAAANMGKFTVGTVKTFQGSIAPGISVQLPYVVLDFRMNTIFSAKSGNGISTVRFMPGIAVELDGLWDVLDPQLQFDGTRYHHWYSYTYKQSVDRHPDYDIITTTTTTTYNSSSFDVYQYNVGPYIAFGPRVTYAQHSWTGKTEMLGVVFSGRSRGLSFDMISETGKVGFASSYLTPSTYDNPEPKGKFNKNDNRFAGDVNCTRGLVRLGFDMNKSVKHANQFTRFMCGMGIGYAAFSNAHFMNDSAAEKLDSYFADNPNVIRNDRVDPREFRNGMFFNLFLSFEMGAISIGWEKNIYKTAALADAGTFSFTYNLPFEKIYDTRQLLKFSKRNNRR